MLLYITLFISLFFEVFLLITYLEVREEMKREDKWRPTKFPTVTVIVPCFNEEETVAEAVKSILNLDYPRKQLSVILVNDGSTDNTLKALNKFKNNPRVKILDKTNGGKHTAVNLALESVSTELVGCLDADSFVMPNALLKIAPYFDDQKTMAVTPSI